LASGMRSAHIYLL